MWSVSKFEVDDDAEVYFIFYAKYVLTIQSFSDIISSSSLMRTANQLTVMWNVDRWKRGRGGGGGGSIFSAKLRPCLLTSG